MWLNILQGTVEQGLVFGLLALGVYLPFRVLDFPDLTVEGSFPLGAAVSAALIINGTNPFLATGIAMFAGVVAGIITGVINTKLKIAGLLAGILTMTSLYSINLRIMGRANIPLLRETTILTVIKDWGFPDRYLALTVFTLLVFLVKFLLDYFLYTEIGMALRATGDSPVMIESLGGNTNHIKILGLGLANGLVALSGALTCQYQGFADVGMGIGMIVIGLASVIIGEVVIRTSKIIYATFGVIVGSVIYRLAITVALQLGFAPTDLKIVTALLVILALGAPTLRHFMIQDEFAERLMERGVSDAQTN
ncbi:MAG TPA: ABC transporter permease [Firmicutes bacterium]|uniref:ABC transporter permease n=1 Tax=Capillibacterium thermochitinicola TaxID=2699427 RepID=A0A8J6HY73_9FIRM|nr:ABC transporter permease [Capillibacterium thermochitinicola]MBA2132190.1 ABC transporter permease [Capillibacterium thermochitinicola]HHW11925.1 ABC transporter permease [Bacillota bacterium]